MAEAVLSKVDTQPSFPAMEQDILALWERIDAFQASNQRREVMTPLSL